MILFNTAEFCIFSLYNENAIYNYKVLIFREKS